MERRDPTLMVALGILGLVLAGLGAIAALRINAEGGFDGLRGGPASPGGWGFGDDPDRGECIELAEALATGGNPWDGEVSTRDDSATETVDGVERGWSVHESRYGDSAAAESAFEALQVLDSPGMKACFQEEPRSSSSRERWRTVAGPETPLGRRHPGASLLRCLAGRRASAQLHRLCND
jgi:hypothetical protein